MTLITFRKKLILLSLFLTLGVIVLGAYTRLVDAGLGCPDWPGCYGLWKAPLSHAEQLAANQAFPLIPVDYQKAHTEMVHRYFASTLGLCIILILVTTFLSDLTLNSNLHKKQKILAVLLVLTVLFQGLLGMWTVTLKLLPIVVMGHLLGGLLLLSLLFCLWLTQKDSLLPKNSIQNNITVSLQTRRLAFIALIAVIIQIALGGWTSTNYAALSCPDFPLCQNQWWPKMSLQAFNVFGALALDNPLTYMSLEARTAIHMAHRIGALITTCLMVGLIFNLSKAIKTQNTPHNKKCILLFIILILSLLTLQLGLGITNVLALLPLKVALAHNFVATLLLLTMIALQFYLKSNPRVL